jgi:hypothetical protein
MKSSGPLNDKIDPAIGYLRGHSFASEKECALRKAGRDG